MNRRDFLRRAAAIPAGVTAAVVAAPVVAAATAKPNRHVVVIKNPPKPWTPPTAVSTPAGRSFDGWFCDDLENETEPLSPEELKQSLSEQFLMDPTTYLTGRF